MSPEVLELLRALPWAIGIVTFFGILWYILDPENKRS